jgi:hypothetical protein
VELGGLCTALVIMNTRGMRRLAVESEQIPAENERGGVTYKKLARHRTMRAQENPYTLSH